jgi:citrate synthase
MDVMLILHADHCMNASTFATMVVASTLSDLYLSVGAGIAALNGPLHGGANEEVLIMLKEIGRVDKVKSWFKEARAEKMKVMGFGHRVYKAYDPRARVLQPLAERLVQDNRRSQRLYDVAIALEKEVVSELGARKGIYPNVDYYSGLVYDRLGVPTDFFTCTFAVSRVAGWSARVLEYMENNRIFRPRALYIGPFNKTYVPLHERVHSRKNHSTSDAAAMK